MLRITLVLAALLPLVLANYNEQPIYQVSIMLEFQPGNPIHLCNGAIIYERLILTTANCVHVRFGAKGTLTKLDASVLSVVAGSTNAFVDALKFNVSDIDVVNNFNPNTLENDLALLTLKRPLPLGTRPDMKWIMLDDNVYVNRSCLANFFSRNSKDTIPNFYQTEELTLYENRLCRNRTAYPWARSVDICSSYILPQQFDCAAAESFLSFNNDRGTGLVCKSYLTGLLSSVVSRPHPKSDCSNDKLLAIYTNIFPHLMWIYGKMAKFETEYISTPYDESLNYLVMKSNEVSDDDFIKAPVIQPNTNSTTTNSTTVLRSNTTLHTNQTLSNATVNGTIHIGWNATTLNSTKPIIPSRNATRSNTTILLSTSATPVKPNLFGSNADRRYPVSVAPNLLYSGSASVRLSLAGFVIALSVARVLV